MKCTCGHHAHYHVEKTGGTRGRCMVNATTIDACRCLVYVSRASYVAALPIRGLDWLLRKAIR